MRLAWFRNAAGSRDARVEISDALGQHHIRNFKKQRGV
jgi:hypothetical protein